MAKQNIRQRPDWMGTQLKFLISNGLGRDTNHLECNQLEGLASGGCYHLWIQELNETALLRLSSTV